MKNSILSHRRRLIVFLLLLFGSLHTSMVSYAEEIISPEEALAVINLKIVSGPTGKVCPRFTYTFRATANLRGCFYWRVRQNGIWYGTNPPSTCGNTISSSNFTYTFLPGGGTITVEVKWVPNPGITNATFTTASRTLLMELGAPAPTLAARGLQFCSTSSAAQTVTIDGVGRSDDGNSCDYHFEYDYEVPTGWLVSVPQGETDADFSTRRVRSQSRVVIVTPTSTATNGTMTVRTRHPDFTVQRTSQVALKVGGTGNGYSTSDFGLTGPSTGSGGTYVTVRANALAGVSTTNGYRWEVRDDGRGTTILTRSGGNTVSFYLPPAGFSVTYVLLRVATSCGGLSAQGYFLIYESGGSFTVFPNPADDFVDISVVNPSSTNLSFGLADGLTEASATNNQTSLSLAKSYQVKLLDEQAQVVRQQEVQTGTVRLDTHNLKPGIYYLHLQEAGGPVTKMPLLIK